MTYIDSLQVIYNVQVWFRNNRMDDLPNNSTIWSREFSKWLADQGGEIDINEELPRNWRNECLGLSPGYDRLKFERNEDATAFLLRWS